MFSVKLRKDEKEVWLDYVRANSKNEAMRNAEIYYGQWFKAVSAFKHKK